MLVPSMQYSLPVDETKKRLQIRVSDGEYQVILNAARKKGMTVSQWVREALRIALGFEAESDQKAGGHTVAATYESPTGSIETMLADIEKGYTRE